MMYIADETIEKIIKEDVPYLDLTSWIMDIGHYQGCIRFSSRGQGVLCGAEEVARICQKLNLRVEKAPLSPKYKYKYDTVFAAKGGGKRFDNEGRVESKRYYCVIIGF